MRLAAIATTVAALASFTAIDRALDPALDPSEAPEGAWMGDMGTVHCAAPHAGECPVCGLVLVQGK